MEVTRPVTHRRRHPEPFAERNPDRLGSVPVLHRRWEIREESQVVAQLGAVVEDYNSLLKLSLSEKQRRDLIEYLKSI